MRGVPPPRARARTRPRGVFSCRSLSSAVIWAPERYAEPTGADAAAGPRREIHLSAAGCARTRHQAMRTRSQPLNRLGGFEAVMLEVTLMRFSAPRRNGLPPMH